jgi:hypothetical protein
MVRNFSFSQRGPQKWGKQFVNRFKAK